MEAGGQAQAVQRLFLGEPFADEVDHRHFPPGPFNAVHPVAGQRPVFDIAWGLLCSQTKLL